MIYRIYKIQKSDKLKEVIEDGYDLRTKTHMVLESLSDFNIESNHNSVESAVSEIHKHKDRLKDCNLTIIPIISIDWFGEIK